MKNISKNITYAEAVRSNTAIRHDLDNTPNAIELEAMELVADKVFQPVREHFDTAIYLSSFFRAPEVNVKAGGSKTSSHPMGEAIDMDADVFGGVTNKEIFDYIKDNLEFDQLIWEYGTDDNPAWVHASFKKSDNRNEILVVKKVDGESHYTYYGTD